MVRITCTTRVSIKDTKVPKGKNGEIYSITFLTENLNKRFIQVTHGMDKDSNTVVELNRMAYIYNATKDDSVQNGIVQPISAVLENSNSSIADILGANDQISMFFEALKRSCPVPIGFEDIPSGAKGYYHTVDQRIALQEGMSEVQTAKTLIHEMAHQKLHSIDPKELPPEEPRLTRNAKEVEAESVAYTVAQHYGIETSDYSFAYIAGWSQGKDTPELKASLDRIRKAADEMITAIDDHIMSLQQEKAPASLEGTNKAENSPIEASKVDGRTSVLKELAERKTEVSDKNSHKKEDKETSKVTHEKADKDPYKKAHKKKEETR